jgi:hypothetical protein
VRAGSAVVAVASAAAIASALGVSRAVLTHLDEWRERYGAMQPSAREGEVARSIALDVGTWERLRRSVREGDRYVVVADAPEQHEVRNYAAYALLPAIQVAEVATANVVIYYSFDPPPRPPCVRIGKRICLVRLEAT